MEAFRLLCLDDNRDDAELMEVRLRDAGLQLEFVHVMDQGGFTSALGAGRWDLLLVDYALPDFDGIAALELVRVTHPHCPVIMISGEIEENTAVEMLKLGATDYVVKQSLERLVPVVVRVLRELDERRGLLGELQDEVGWLRRLLDGFTATGEPPQPLLAELADTVRRIEARIDVALGGCARD